MKKFINISILTMLSVNILLATAVPVLAVKEEDNKTEESSINLGENSSTDEPEMTVDSSEIIYSSEEVNSVSQENTIEKTTESTVEMESDSSVDVVEDSTKEKNTLSSIQQYVTVTSANYTTYSDFNGWKKLYMTSELQNKTFLAKEKINHTNNLAYFSLFDSEDNWYGYVNVNATKVASGKQGIYQNYGKFVSISNKNYTTYRNFSWTPLGNTKETFEKTFQARGKYEHFNGLTYLSLYDNTGKWYGYVNQNATKVGNGRQGAYQNYGKYVTVTNSNYTTYHNFSWSKLGMTKTMSGRTYEARGKYEHFNGLTYLSLFDNNGTWYGYVNANAVAVGDGRQGVYQSFNRHVLISSKNYSMYQSFNWSVRQQSSAVYNKGLIAKGKYVHFNGLTYYSVYDGLGNWQGYINANGTKLVTYKDNPTTYYSQMSIGAWYGCAATSLYTVLRAKGYAGNVTLVNFINGLPLSNDNPDVGQIGDPWGKTPFKRVISPIGLNKYASKYTNTSEVITGSSTDRVISEINSGNYVLYWGEYTMRDADKVTNPQHVMIARGYKVVNGKEYILIQDPGLYTSSSPLAIRWYEKNAFDDYVSKKYRKMMVVR